MANSETEDWRSPHFRQKVTNQIDDALRKSGNPQMMTRNAADIERDVFSKAKSRDEYMCFVARVLVFARDVGPGRVQPGVRPGLQPGQPGQPVPQMGTKVQMQPVPASQPMRTMYSTPHISATPMTSVTNASYKQHQMAFRNMVSQPQPQQPQMNPQTMAQITQAMSQHQQYPSNLSSQPQMQVTTQPVQQQSVLGHTATVSANQPHPSPQMVSSQHGQQSHPVSSTVSQMQARMQTVPSPAVRTQASHPSPAASQPFIPSPAYQPTQSPAPGVQHGMTPSPQQSLIPQSPATSSVPTPGTLNVQSPASILNPGSVGPPAASPAPLSAAEEQAYLEKHKQLSVYIEPLTRMINKMNRDQGKFPEHSTNDLKKLKNFLDILTNPSKRLSLAVLEKCEQVLKKMNLKPPQRTTAQTTSPTTASQSTVVAKSSATALTTSSRTIQSIEDHSQQISGQALYETVIKHLKSPLFSHTLKRTFSPLVQSMEGPPICPPPPPNKKLRLTQTNQKKCTLPHILQGELARLCDHFTVKPEIDTGSSSQSSTLLRCSINDEFLPAVPPIEISVPQNYPHSSPACKANAYEATPFLLKIRSHLQSELRRMPGFYSVTSLLSAWEASIRQACMSEVAVK